MPEPIVVHTLDDARAALKAAAESGQFVTLQSAPDAVLYAGSLYLLTLYRQACAEYPAAGSVFVLDCADAAAQALEAMRIGHTHIRIDAEPIVADKLRSAAEQLGVSIISA